MYGICGYFLFVCCSPLIFDAKIDKADLESRAKKRGAMKNDFFDSLSIISLISQWNLRKQSLVNNKNRENMSLDNGGTVALNFMGLKA